MSVTSSQFLLHLDIFDAVVTLDGSMVCKKIKHMLSPNYYKIKISMSCLFLNKKILENKNPKALALEKASLYFRPSNDKDYKYSNKVSIPKMTRFIIKSMKISTHFLFLASFLNFIIKATTKGMRTITIYFIFTDHLFNTFNLKGAVTAHFTSFFLDYKSKIQSIIFGNTSESAFSSLNSSCIPFLKTNDFFYLDLISL